MFPMNDLSSMPNDMNNISPNFYIGQSQIPNDFCIQPSTMEQNSKSVNFPYVAFRQPKKPIRKQITNAKRIRSNQKEQKRNMDINSAFQRLQRTIPHIPNDYRLPRVKTLRLAMNYIEHLSNTLNKVNAAARSSSSTASSIVNSSSAPTVYQQTSVQIGSHFQSTTTTVQFNDFSQIVENELQTKNTYTDRATDLLMRQRANVCGSTTPTVDYFWPTQCSSTSFDGNYYHHPCNHGTFM